MIPSPRVRHAAVAALLVVLLVPATLAQTSRRPDGGDKVELKDVFQMLDEKLPEEQIRRRLGATVFVISAKDERELARRGASDELIEFMKQLRGEKNPEITDFAIVLDCSRSMLETTKDGTTKMQAARQAVAELIRKLPAELKVTFVIYGHRQENPCSAVEVIRPIGVLGEDGRAELLEHVEKLNGIGATPIALALRTAGKELAKNNAPCGLVLISDGKESCKGDPAAEAARLAQTLPISFGVNVVGFDVAGEESDALEAIAKSGKGKYYSAGSAEELAAALGKVHEKVSEAHGVPKQRDDRKTELAGTKGKAGAFLHNAGLVEPGEFTGKLAMMEGHYYRVAARKGQELRAIGQFKKTPYNIPADGSNIQTFSVTIYDAGWNVVAREKVDVKDTPAGLQTARATWTASSDGFVYVGVAASDNHNSDGRPANTFRPDSHGLVEKGLDPSSYTLRLRLEGESPETAEAIPPVPQLSAKLGSGFEGSGELTIPGAAGGDLKLGEAAFFRAKAKKGDRLVVAAGVQKPWFNVPIASSLQATYTLTVYDDDQVEIAKKELKLNNNPPDAQILVVDVTVPLSGNIYVGISGVKSAEGIQFGGNGFYPADFKPRPGHIAVQIVPAGAKNPEDSQ